MPSFLNKVFGYKKHDDKESARPTRDAADNTLLDGKYEAIPPVVSPSNSVFAEHPTKDSDHDVLGFSLFKAKSRGFPHKSSRKDSAAVPHLTLHLPASKDKSDSRALGVVFEADPDAQTVLDDVVIAAKRLNPLQALILIRACARAITERGLETLGIMHPHWFSASPDIQRKLISLFIRSLSPQSRITTLSTPPTSPPSTFENELHYTRSPHDVAAVFRWALRHLSLENGQFGNDADLAWYNTFFHAERKASYPPKAFSELLLPQLPAPHVELLTAMLNIISSLAAHAEANSISGSKLSKFLGLWLLAPIRADQSDDWMRFYARWERAGRILEHIFLARLREESFAQRLPTRLQELVEYYPYNKGSPTVDINLLSRPRFSTRQYDALLVRVESLLSQNAKQPKQHPVQLLLEAFQLPVENAFRDHQTSLWHTLKSTVSGESTASNTEGPQFSCIFVDETIQVLSLIPADSNAPMSPTFLTSPITDTMSRKRSSSPAVFQRTGSEYNTNTGSTPVSPASPTSPVITDWAQFSLSGFGDTPAAQPLAAVLEQDNDIEVTQPRLSRKSSRQRKSRSRRRRSEDREPSDNPPSSRPDHRTSTIETKLASVHVVQIDEAFVDFWSDAIVDPISDNWPTFVVCGLKQIPNVNQSIRWLIIEQTYSRQQPQNSRVPSPDSQRGRSPRPSFKSDISGFRINSVLSSARKRFSVFSKSATDLELKKSAGKIPIAGELGEVLVEEETTRVSVADTAIGTTATGGATAGIADQLKANEIDATPIAGAAFAESAHASKELLNAAHVVEKVPSVEPTPQLVDENNSVSAKSGTPEGSVPVDQCSPRTLDGVDQGINNATDLVTKMTPLAAELLSSLSTHDTSDPTVFVSVLTAENPVAAEPQMKAEPVRQDVVIEAQRQFVKSVLHPRDVGELPADSSGEPSTVVQVDVADVSQASVESVTGFSSLPAVAVPVILAAQPAVAAAVDDRIPGPAGGESHVVNQPSRNAPADPSAVEPVAQQKIDDLPPVPTTDILDQILTAETPAQPEDAIIRVVDEPEEAEEVAEQAEVPTPTPEHVVLVEETSGPEASVDDHELTCAAHVHPPENEPVADAGPQGVATASQVALRATEPSISFPVEAPFLEITPATDKTAQILAVETEHAVDRVPELAPEEAHQDTIVETTVADVSAAHESTEDASVEVQVDDAPDMGAPTPIAETESTPLDAEMQPCVKAELSAQSAAAEPAEYIPGVARDEIIVADTTGEPAFITPAKNIEAHAPAPQDQDILEAVVEPSESAEAAPSIAANPELVEDGAAPSACEPDVTASTVVTQERATHDVQPCVEDSSSDQLVGGVSGPEETSTAELMEAARLVLDVVEETVAVVVASESEVPAAEQEVIKETALDPAAEGSPVDAQLTEAQVPETDVNRLQDIVDVPSKQFATGEIDSVVES